MAGSKRSISAINVPLKTDLSGFRKGFSDAKKDADKFHRDTTSSFGLMGKGISDSIEKANGKLKTLGGTNLGMVTKGLAGLAAAAVASAGAIAALGFHRISELGKDALTLGTSAESLSRLRAVARATGTDVSDLGEFVKGLTQDLNDSIGKTTPASEALKALGTSAEELSKLTPEEQLSKLNKLFAALPEGTDKAGLAFMLAGERGVKMFRVLTMGSKDFQDEMDKAPIVTDEEVSEIRKLQIALDKLMSTVVSLADFFTTKLAPPITAIADLLTGIAGKFGVVVKSTASAIQDSLPPASAKPSSNPPDPAAKTKSAAAQQQADADKRVNQARKNVADLEARHTKLAGRPNRGRMVPSTNGTRYIPADRSMATQQTDVAQRLNAARKELETATNQSKSPTRQMTDAMRKNQGLIRQVAELKQEYRSTIETSGQDEIHRRVSAIKGISTPDRKALIQQGYLSREANKTSGLRDELQESTKLPIEKLGEDLARISRLAALGPSNGGLTKLQSIRAAAQKTAESGVAGGQVQLAGAIQSNSIEGRSYLLSQMFGGPQDALEVARQGVEATMQGNGFLSRIVTAVGRPDVTVSF